MLIEFDEREYHAAIDAARAAAIPGDVPEWVAEIEACPRCRNSGEPCGYCGGSGYGDEQAEPLPTIASITSEPYGPECPYCDDGWQPCDCFADDGRHEDWCDMGPCRHCEAGKARK